MRAVSARRDGRLGSFSLLTGFRGSVLYIGSALSRRAWRSVVPGRPIGAWGGVQPAAQRPVFPFLATPSGKRDDRNSPPFLSGSPRAALGRRLPRTRRTFLVVAPRTSWLGYSHDRAATNPVQTEERAARAEVCEKIETGHSFLKDGEEEKLGCRSRKLGGVSEKSAVPQRDSLVGGRNRVQPVNSLQVKCFFRRLWREANWWQSHFSRPKSCCPVAWSNRSLRITTCQQPHRVWI